MGEAATAGCMFVADSPQSFADRVLDLLTDRVERGPRTVVVEAHLPDPEPQLVELSLLGREGAIGRERGGNVCVVIRVVRAGVENDEVAVPQGMVVSMVVTPGMVFPCHDDGLIRQFLRTFALADELEEGCQGSLGHTDLRGANELEVRPDPDPRSLSRERDLSR